MREPVILRGARTAARGGIEMTIRYVASVGVLAALVVVCQTPVVMEAQTPRATAGQTPRTPWGTPDLQGIWGNEEATPLERPQEFGTREFLTDAERAAREKQVVERSEAAKGGLTGFRDKRKESGTEKDVAGAYNAIWEG